MANILTPFQALRFFATILSLPQLIYSCDLCKLTNKNHTLSILFSSEAKLKKFFTLNFWFPFPVVLCVFFVFKGHHLQIALDESITLL